MAILRFIGRGFCAIGLHRRPYETAPCPPGVAHEAYRYDPLYTCRRCGATGRVDCRDNLLPTASWAVGNRP